jgi:hypothetical protein
LDTNARQTRNGARFQGALVVIAAAFARSAPIGDREEQSNGTPVDPGAQICDATKVRPLPDSQGAGANIAGIDLPAR